MIQVLRSEIAGADDFDQAAGRVAGVSDDFDERRPLVDVQHRGVGGVRIDRPQGLLAGGQIDLVGLQCLVEGEPGAGGLAFAHADEVGDVCRDQGAVNADRDSVHQPHALDGHDGEVVGER